MCAGLTPRLPGSFPSGLSFLWQQGQGAAIPSSHRSEETAQGRRGHSCARAPHGAAGISMLLAGVSLSWAAEGLGGDEWQNCPSLALRFPWGAGRSERLPLGNATRLEEPDKTRNNVKNVGTQHLHPAAAYSGSGTGTESAWIRVISCILWVWIMYPGCNRKQKCKE